MSIFDDIWSWLTTSPGGSAGGTPYLGAASPTASTQTPIMASYSTGAPMLGGQPPAQGGFLSGLLGGQQPVNPMSYFMPRQGLLGNSPLGMGLRGGLAGLAAGAGQGGLSGFGTGAMGGQQEEMQRRQAQMNAVLAGQQYQKGQYGLVGDVLQNQQMLQMINYRRHLAGQNPVTMDQVLADPTLAQTNMPGQAVATAAPTTAPAISGTTVPAAGGGTVTIPGTTYSMPDTQRTLPSGSTATLPGQQTTIPSVTYAQIKQAFGNLEGGIDPVSGAIGGLTQGTFNQYAKPGESFDDPNARAAVSDRVIADLAAKSGGDPAKIARGDYSGVDPARLAVGWFSGPGNIAPPGATVPWNYDAHDAHGTTVSGYVSNFAKQLGQTPAQGQQPTMAPAATGQGQPTATGAPQSLPMTIPEIEASNLPDWAKMSLENALYSADPAEISKAYSTVGQYLAAPGQAAATTTATGAATFETPQAKYEREQKQQEIQRTQLTNLRGDYEKEDAVKILRQALPAATAFGQIYQAHGANTNTPGPNYQGDYALIINALKTINPDAASPRPGQAISATDLATLPAQLQKAILSAWNNQTALPGDAVDQLAKAVQNQITVYQKDQQRVESHFRDRAKTEIPGVPETTWNTDLPVPPPDAIKALQANPTKAMIADFDDTFGIGAAAQLGITAQGS